MIKHKAGVDLQIFTNISLDQTSWIEHIEHVIPSPPLGWYGAYIIIRTVLAIVKSKLYGTNGVTKPMTVALSKHYKLLSGFVELASLVSFALTHWSPNKTVAMLRWHLRKIFIFNGLVPSDITSSPKLILIRIYVGAGRHWAIMG